MLRLKKTQFISLLFVTVLLLSVSIAAFSPYVSADENQQGYVSTTAIDGAILDHQLYYYLLACFYAENVKGIDDSQINKWQFIDNSGGAKKIARGILYSNAAPSCEDAGSMEEAFNRFGFTDPVDTFCSLSFTYNEEYGGFGKAGKGDGGNKSKAACMTGKGAGFGWDGSGGSGASQRNAVKKLLLTSEKGQAASKALSSEAEYVRSYRSFMNGCSINLIQEYDDASDPASGQKNLYKVAVVSLGDSGQATTTNWLGRTDADPNKVPDWDRSAVVGIDIPVVSNDEHGDSVDGINNGYDSNSGLLDFGSPHYDVNVGTNDWKVPYVATQSGKSSPKTCGELATATRTLAPEYQKYVTANPDDATAVGSAGNTTGLDDANCGDFSLKKLISAEWIICPMIQGFMDLASQLEDGIAGMLCINESEIFTGASSTCSNTASNEEKTSSAFKAAWNVFRILALGMLAIGGLVMIISQALGFEIVDAYTVKKVLPRLLIAAIGISLSWQLLQFLVTLSNVLGIGVRALIYSPFRESGIDTSDILSGGASAITAIFAAGSFVALGALGLLSFVATAALAVIIAFFVLIIRNVLVIFLIIAAPVAIAAYILPNTEKYFKIWWEWLFKALMVFPIITAMIAIGHVFAAITVASNDGSLLQTFVAFAAYFAPYFLIPAAFRFAGGALATIGGFANDRSRGGFDRLKKFRQGQTAKNWQKTKNFDRFSERSAIGRGINTALGAAANPTSVMGGADGVRARRRASRNIQGQQFAKENGVFQANMNDDNFLLAVADRQMAQEKIAKAQSTLERKKQTAVRARSLGLSSDQITAADQGVVAAQASLNARMAGMDSANQLPYFERENGAVKAAAFDALTKSGYQYDTGEKGYAEMKQTAERIYGANDKRGMSQAMDNAQYNARASGGRYDLGGINNGAGFSLETGLNKGSLYELANGKGDSLKAWNKDLKDKAKTGGVGIEHAVAYKELQAMLPNTKGGNRDETVKMIEQLKSDGVEQFMLAETKERQTVKLTAGGAQEAAAQGNPWSAAEAKQGWRYENRTVSNSDLASRSARAYERPDPNNLQ